MLSRFRSPLLIAAAGLLLSWPAFYNGYPLVWYDSCGYLIAGLLRGSASILRSPFYGFFLVPLLALRSTWPIVFTQATIAAAMIFLVLRCLLGRVSAGWYFLLVGLLALATSLPWNASLILADVFAGLLPLGVFLLAFGRARLSPWESAFVFAITSLATVVHYSHLPLVAALAGVAVAVLLLERRSPRVALRAAAPCLAVVLAALAAHLGLQWTLNGTPEISSDGPVFLLARLQADGPAAAYLSAHCSERHFAVCAFVHDLPMNADQFLWDPRGPVKRLGGVEALRDEASVIVAGALREQPVRIALLVARHTARQLISFHTGFYLRGFMPPGEVWQTCDAVTNESLPGEYKDFAGSRQATGDIGLKGIFSLQIASVVASLALLLVQSRWILFRGDRPLRELLWLVLATLGANAFICGALSGPSDRYQGRVIWLLPFLLCLVSISAIESRRFSPRQAR